MKTRAPRDYLAGRYVAQEARRAGQARADDHAYARGEVVDTDQRPAAAPLSGVGNAAGAPPIAPSAAAGHLFVLPLPPSVNVLYGTTRTGQKFLTQEQRDFRAHCAAVIGPRIAQPLAGRLAMTVTLYFANRRRADIDNRLKAIFDGCTHAGAYHDDSQIDVLYVERVVRPKTDEEAVVKVQELD